MKKNIYVAPGMWIMSLVCCNNILAQIGSTQPTITSFKVQLNPIQNFYKQRLSMATNLSKAFANYKTNAGTASNTQEGLVSNVTINKTPFYTTAAKTETSISGSTGQCSPFKVNFTKSDIEFTVDATTNAQLRSLIYPGSLLNATNLLNGNYNNSTSSLPVPSMNIITTMLPLSATDSAFRTVNSPSAANVNTAINQMYNLNAAGGTNSPTIQYVEGYILESDNQWRVESKHTWDFNINESLSIPVEIINIKAGGGASGSISTSGSVSIQQKRSYAVLVFKQLYYSANIEPVQSAGTAGGTGKFFNTAASNIPEDLIYIKTVDYGRILYLVISADATRQDLAFALNRKFGVNLDMGLNVAGSELGVSGSESAGYSDEFTLNRVFQQSNISYKMVVYGGNPIPLTDLTNISPGDVLNAPDNSISGLINKIASKANINLSVNNVPAPIGFTCCFAKDGATAWVNSNVNYYSQTCNSVFKYDVQLELDRIESSNCRDLDGSEDLYGSLKFTYLKAGSKEVNTDKVYWTMSENNSNENPFRNGSHPVDETKTIITGLTYNEMRNVVLYIGGELHDDEGPLASRDFKCDNCQELNGDFGKRKIFFNELSNTQKSINMLIPDNNNFQALKFGDDTFFQLNFYESGKSSDGTVKVFWRVKVKAYTIYTN